MIDNLTDPVFWSAFARFLGVLIGLFVIGVLMILTMNDNGAASPNPPRRLSDGDRGHRLKVTADPMTGNRGGDEHNREAA